MKFILMICTISVFLQDLLTKHKTLCADFLERNYDGFFNKYHDLLNSENYVTRRQSLKVKPKETSFINLIDSF
jgi:hypothetical protein